MLIPPPPQVGPVPPHYFNLFQIYSTPPHYFLLFQKYPAPPHNPQQSFPFFLFLYINGAFTWLRFTKYKRVLLRTPPQMGPVPPH